MLKTTYLLCLLFVCFSLQWFHNENNHQDQEKESLEVVKAKADHAYAKHNFDHAGDLYLQILDRQTSMPMFREACEGRVRCLIKNPNKSQKTEALELAMEMVITAFVTRLNRSILNIETCTQMIEERFLKRRNLIGIRSK